MTPDRQSLLSRTLSFGLRHQPHALGLLLDKEGWCSVDDVLSGLATLGHTLSRADLEYLVATSDKQRFALSNDGLRIRANQGHTSKEVALTFEQKQPPALLYHGTINDFLPSILKKGLAPMRRHHVHLSPNVATAQQVGARRGRAIILEVAAAKMAEQGHAFYLSANGVWLTNHVDPMYLRPIVPEA